MKNASLLMVVLVVAGLAAAAHAEFLTNGDFEADPYDYRWPYGNGGSTSLVHRGLTGTGLDAEGTQAAYLIAGAGSSSNSMLQNFSTPGATWQVDLLFAAEACNNRSLSLRLYDTSGGQIYLRVYTNNRLMASSRESSYHTVSTVNITPSIDADNNQSFADEGDTLNVHSLRIVGHYDSDTPSYDVYMSQANSPELELLAEGLTWFWDQPTTNAGLSRVNFYTSGADGNVVVDNISVTVPEPATLGLIGIGGVMTLIRRRRK